MTPHPNVRRSTAPPRRSRPGRRTVGIALLATATVLAGTASAIAGPTTPGPAAATSTQAAAASELSETTRLADRRSQAVTTMPRSDDPRAAAAAHRRPVRKLGPWGYAASR